MNHSSLAKEESIILPWDNFSSWIHCICVVTFDLELGQAMELIYPKHTKLTESERANISYLAFPDSNSGCMGDTAYHFRIRISSCKRLISQKMERYNSCCPNHLSCSANYAFGYTYFRQVRDKSIRRGYFQKSVVVISPLPLIPLFNKVNSIIAPQFFDHGAPSLEAACHDIDQWPGPACGSVQNLPLMGTVLQIHIPAKGDRMVQTTDSDLSIKIQEASLDLLEIVPSVYEVNLYRAFYNTLPNLQLIWELVLTSQPMLVMGSSPSDCSQLVQALVSCIFPVKYATDYRPFFTIHDSEFKEFTTKAQAAPQVILGVTNPFFSKALDHWPNIIRIQDTSSSPKESKKVKKTAALFKSEEAKPGIYTRYKPFLSKDQTLYKRIKKGSQNGRPNEIQTLIIRRFLLELTQSFMIPLERYVASLMPLQRNISPFKGVPCLGRFNMNEFFRTVEQAGPQLTCGIKGDWIGLYKKFFSCPNFAAWLSQRQVEINSKLQQLHIESLCQASMSEWIKDKHEVELVDMIIHINDKLNLCMKHEIQMSPDQVVRLRNHIDTVMTALPEDLRSVVKQSSSGCGATISMTHLS